MRYEGVYPGGTSHWHEATEEEKAEVKRFVEESRRKILFDQIMLIKEEAEKHPKRILELSKAMKDTTEAFIATRGMH